MERFKILWWHVNHLIIVNIIINLSKEFCETEQQHEEQIASIKSDYEAKIKKQNQEFTKLMTQVEENMNVAEQNHKEEIQELNLKIEKLEFIFILAGFLVMVL